MSLTFGPVPSRRFGVSLGIDLSPNSKQCNFDCLYCELKASKTVSFQSNSPKVSDIIIEVKQALKKNKNIEVITLTANGEPTLYPYLEKLVDELNLIKENKKILILSNGGTIYKKNIQKILNKIDIVKLSLDCVSNKCFEKLNRIDKSVDCRVIVKGMIDFRKIYKKEFIIEIPFVKNLNDNQNEIELLNDTLIKIKPNRIDIGTIDRPPAFDVLPLNFEELNNIANSFKNFPVNVIFKNRPKMQNSYSKDDIINTLKMRPLTKDDIENNFDDNSKKILDILIKNKIVQIIQISHIDFYKVL